MAMKVESLGNSPNSSLRLKGELGDLEISEDTSEGDDDKTYSKHKASRTLNAVQSLPSCLVKNSTVPVFGSVAVTDSENVQFGNNTYFNGPVTIKQVFQGKSGLDNPSYNVNDNEFDGTPAKFQEKPVGLPVEKLQILVWHKVSLSVISLTVIGGIIAMIIMLQNKFEHESSPIVPDFGNTDSNDSAFRTVVVHYLHEYLHGILITVIILPLTIVIIFCSLLTREVRGSARRPVEKTVRRENILVKSCMKCHEGVDPLIIAPGHLRIVSRTDWLAQPVEGQLDRLIQPVPWVIITHTATASCHNQSQCVLSVRLIQQFHVESRGWFDIGYNFMVGGDGSVYYGRGWDYEGAHTKYYNKYSIGIAFIGTFNNDSPPKQQVDACRKLIRLGVSQGKLLKDYRLFAHRQLMSTLSPGDKVYDIIKEWPHFVKNYTDIEELLPPDRRQSLG